MDTHDSLTSEYFSLPSLKDTESVHSYSCHIRESNEHVQESSNNYGSGKPRCDYFDHTISISDKISQIRESGSVSLDNNIADYSIKDHGNNVWDCERRKSKNEDLSTRDSELKNDPQIRNDSNIKTSRFKSSQSCMSHKEAGALNQTTRKVLNEEETINMYDKRCSSQNENRNDENPNQIETSQHSDDIGLEEPVTLRHNASSSLSNESPGRVSVAIQVPRIRSSIGNDTTSAPASLTRNSSSCESNMLQRPSSLPFGNPPSYMEALRCSTLKSSLPYDLNINQSWTSLYTLNNSSLFNNVYDYFLDADSTHLERAPRLLAFPSVPAIHTISRSAATTPCVSLEDGILDETIIPTTEGFDSHPCAAFCKACQITVLTTTTTSYRSSTYCCCFLMFFSGVCCPFSFLPFFLCGPKKVFHMCPQCKNVMGFYIDKD